MKNNIKRRLGSNLGLKALALLVSFLIWMVVTNSNNPSRTILFNNVPITIVNQDSIADIGKVVELAGKGTVTLKVTERRTVLDRLAKNGSDFYVEADMENINDMNTVPLTVTCSNQSVTWDEINISPASLKVTLEDKVEQAFVISPSTSGSPASGFEVGRMEVKEGKNIYIAGPKSVMQIINQVVAPVNVAGLSSDTTVPSTLKIIDKNGEELSDSKMSTLEIKDSEGMVLNERAVQVAVTMWKQQTDIPIFVETTGTPAFGYRVANISTIPVTISLAGTDEALAALDGKFVLNEKVSVAGASQNITQDIDITSMMAELPNLKLITDG
ncbi:MAG: CdaR family protein, partial [Lachnospiraceae bacterium]|nr:CdaR family protein [Lachnospiraceae bacterium]